MPDPLTAAPVGFTFLGCLTDSGISNDLHAAEVAAERWPMLQTMVANGSYSRERDGGWRWWHSGWTVFGQDVNCGRVEERA